MANAEVAPDGDANGDPDTEEDGERGPPGEGGDRGCTQRGAAGRQRAPGMEGKREVPGYGGGQAMYTVGSPHEYPREEGSDVLGLLPA